MRNRYRLLGMAILMGLCVVLSNFLVQYPVPFRLGGLELSSFLTFGAFTYPFSFVVNDATNYIYGPFKARLTVLFGFALGVLSNLVLWHFFPENFSLRILLASGVAFLSAQLLDVSFFLWLSRRHFLLRPFGSSVVCGALDTLLFFSIAFAGTSLPWETMALGDYCVKILMAGVMLAPYYGLVRDVFLSSSGLKLSSEAL